VSIDLVPLRQDRTSTAPVFPLRAFGDRTAVLTEQGSLSYAGLADRVDARAVELGPVPRLVMVRAANAVEPLVTYLAALAGGHPVLLADADDGPRAARLAAAYRPDVIFGATEDGWLLEEIREGTCHRLHPELALLLSTSGSTGSPKLVRLSQDNLRSNAASIASYLRLTPDDRAATTLPMHYCYGLSVLNSHLAVGASLLLTERSVVEERFWSELRTAEATSFAGVPYTFDLLDASGFAERDLPSLRYVTAAGGRLGPERVRRYARLGRERGFDLVVMYGQTEATARMAFLPPHLAESRPETIGVPIPGGSFEIAAPDKAGVGELVYSGSNVMLGYADGPADLAEGRTVEVLRTGDLAVQHTDGLYELVGRESRRAKLFGLRVDLDWVERLLDDHGVAARVVHHEGRLAVFVTRRVHLEEARALVLGQCALPQHAVRVHHVETLPTTSTGKPDYAALDRHAEVLDRAGADRPGSQRHGTASASQVRDLFAELLGRPDARETDSFVTLRGDSLSYVEMSIRLGELLGELPRDWQDLSARDLADQQRADAEGSRSVARGTRVDTSVLLRTVSIVLIVATHANVLTLMGGAHLMLGVAGFNLARFQLSDLPRGQRLRSIAGAVRQVAVPSMMWIGLAAAATGMYDLPTVVLLNQALGSDSWTTQWQFWFLDALVWSFVGAAALVGVPALDRWERRAPFGFAGAVVVGTLASRYALVGVHAGPSERYALPIVLWCLALGWWAARARSTRQRVLVSLVVMCAVPGFFGEPVREALVVGGLLALLWLPAVMLPRVVARLAAVIASASLFVYLTHWQVYPHLEDHHPYLATAASFAVGLAVWKAYTAMAIACSGFVHRGRGQRTSHTPA
jgi:acyl-CoA synthetase (AMP-forming)/AMP-acid ligase II